MLLAQTDFRVKLLTTIRVEQKRHCFPQISKYHIWPTHIVSIRASARTIVMRQQTQTTQTFIELKVTANTVLKTLPVQASELPDSEKLLILPGIYQIKSYDHRGNHLLINPVNNLGGRAEWYIFEGHVELLTLSPYPENNDQPEAQKEGAIELPGYSQIFYLSEPIIENGNFTWAEATKNGRRIPQSKQIVDSIIALAHKMEEVRNLFGGQPITVTSWYRDPFTNKRVGGASKSTHILGHGIDFNVAGFSPIQVQHKLENVWTGGMGYGRNFTHLDMRNYKARWNYIS